MLALNETKLNGKSEYEYVCVSEWKDVKCDQRERFWQKKRKKYFGLIWTWKSV